MHGLVWAAVTPSITQVEMAYFTLASLMNPFWRKTQIILLILNFLFVNVVVNLSIFFGMRQQEQRRIDTCYEIYSRQKKAI